MEDMDTLTIRSHPAALDLDCRIRIVGLMALFVSFLILDFFGPEPGPLSRIACCAGLVPWVLAVQDDWGSGRWGVTVVGGGKKQVRPKLCQTQLINQIRRKIRVIAHDRGMCLEVMVVSWFLFRRLS